MTTCFALLHRRTWQIRDCSCYVTGETPAVDITLVRERVLLC